MALAAALVWELHPLNTEVVNYVSQRTESLMALCCLLTLYAAIRAAAHPERWGWRAASIGACAIGMASKESMVTAPVLVLLYDRVFLFPSFKTALRERAALYAGLAATWAVLRRCSSADRNPAWGCPPGSRPGPISSTSCR